MRPWGRRTTHGWMLGLLCALLSGCAAVPQIPPVEAVKVALPGEPAAPEDYWDFAGAIHIQSTYSKGSGSFEEILAAATRQRLDFVLITDHDTLQGLWKHPEGRYGRVLALWGSVINTDDGRYLACRLTDEIRPYRSIEETLQAVQAQGGLGFIPYPFYRTHPWTRWDARGFDGLEVYSLSQDVLDEPGLGLLVASIFLPIRDIIELAIDRPARELALWDTLTQERRVVGIAGHDARGKRWGWIQLGSYDMVFQLVRTHILARALTRDEIYHALATGHVYVAFDGFEEATGFRFDVRDAHDATVALMGDELALPPQTTLVCELPRRATIRLIQDGREVVKVDDTVLRRPLTKPGVYRIEVDLRGRLWIFSNPIYVRPAVEPPVTSSPLPEASDQMTEDRSQKTEDRGQMTEDR